LRSKLRRFSLWLASMLLGAGVAAGYDLILGPDGARVTWNSGTIPFVVRMAETPTLQDGSNYASSVIAAMNAWNSQLANVQFSATSAGAGLAGDGNGINEIAFDSKIYSNAADGGRDFGPNVLAVTLSYRAQTPRGDGSYERTQSDILFNTAWTWNSYRGALRTAEDIRRVAIHELGHVLGLDHPDQAGQTVVAIMNSTASAVDALQADDITGAQWYYGRPGGFTPPSNDRFADAATVTLNGTTATATASSVGATKESGEPDHASAEVGGASIWWKWVAPGSGTVTATTAGSAFDTLLAAYTGSAVNALTQLASNDDVERGVVRTSTVTFGVSGGTTYYFAVDGWAGLWGSAQLNLSYQPSSTAPPVIMASPFSQTRDEGNAVLMMVTLVDYQGASFAWQRLPAGSGEWQDIPAGSGFNGLGTSQLSFTATFAMNGDQFRCIVTNGGGSTTSAAATLTVRPRAPFFVRMPANVSAVAGGSATFSAEVGGTAPLTLQWSFSGSPIPGANSATLQLTNVQANQAGFYRLDVTNAYGGTGAGASLTLVTPPTISSQPTSASVEAGENVTFSVLIGSNGPVTYQWYRDGVALPGETGSTLFLSSVSQSAAGAYSVVATNAAGSVTSAAALLSVSPATLPNIFQQPQSSSILVGQSVSFFVGYSSRSSATVQWLRNGVELPGQNSRTLSIASATFADAGTYTARITNAGGSVVTSPVTLEVRSSPPPDVSVVYVTSSSASSVTLSVAVGAGSQGPYTYQWYRDGQPLSGETGATLTIAGFDAADGGDYFALVANAAGSAISRTYELKAPAANANLWTAAQEHAGVVYFALTGPARLARYDLAAATWLPDVPLPGMINAIATGASGVYLLSGTAIYRLTDEQVSLFAELPIPCTALALTDDAKLVAGNGANLAVVDVASRRVTAATGVSTYAPLLLGFVYDAGSRKVFGFDTSFGPRLRSVEVSESGLLGRITETSSATDNPTRVFLVPDGRHLLTNAGSIHRIDDLAQVGNTTGGFDDLIADGSNSLVVSAGVVMRLDSRYREIGRARFSIPASRIAARGSYLVGFAPPDTATGRPRVESLPLGAIAEPALPASVLAPTNPLVSPRIFSDGSGVIYIHSKLDRQVYRWSALEGRYLPSIPVRFWPDQLVAQAGQGSLAYARGSQVRRSGLGGLGDSPYAGGPRDVQRLFSVGESLAVVSEQGGRLLRWNGEDLARFGVGSAFSWVKETGELHWLWSTIFYKTSFNEVGTQGSSGYVGPVPHAAEAIWASPNGGRAFLSSGWMIDTTAGGTIGSRLPGGVVDATWGSSDDLFALVAGADGLAVVQKRSAAANALLASRNLSGLPRGITTLPNGDLAVVTLEAGSVVFTLLSTSDLSPVASTSGAPTVVQGPRSFAAAVGQPVALDVTVRSGSAVSYQWLKDGVAIPGAVARELVIPNFQADAIGQYAVRIANASGSLTSASASLTRLVPPTLTAEPRDDFRTGDVAAGFSVTAEGGPPLGYRWLLNSSPLTDPQTAQIEGGPFYATTGFARVEVRNRAATTVSRRAIVARTGPPVVTITRVRAGTTVGSVAILRADVTSGGPELSYQWRRNGIDLPGQTSPWFTLGAAQTADAGAYTVAVTNRFGTTESPSVQVDVLVEAGIVAQQAGVYLREDGSLWGVGSSFFFGSFNSGIPNRFPQLIATQVASFAMLPGQLIYLRRDGTLYRFGVDVPLLNEVVGMTAGYDAHYAIRRDSSLWLVSTNVQPVTLRRVAENVRSARFGASASFALTWQDEVYAWGANFSGHFGNGTTNSSETPVLVMTGVRDVCVDGTTAYFLRNDGTLLSAGSNSSGELAVPNPSGLGPFVVATGVREVRNDGVPVFIKENGELWRFGATWRGPWQVSSGVPLRVASDVRAVSADRYTALYVTSSGALYGVGQSSSGELGTIAYRVDPPALVTNDAVRSATVGTYFLTQDGRYFALGAANGSSATPFLVARGPAVVVAEPTNLAATREGTRVLLTWTPVSGAERYEISRRPVGAPESASTVIGTTLLAGLYVDTPPDAGQYVYAVRAASSFGTGSSTPGQTSTLALPPAIVTQPSALTLPRGAEAAEFTVVATGVRSYQWRRNGVALVEGNGITGTTTATLRLSPVLAAAAGTYDVLLTNGNGTTTSAPAALTLREPVTGIDLTSRTLPATPQLYTVAVTSDGEWTTSGGASWASVYPATARGNGTATIIVDANLGADTRSLEVVIGGNTHRISQSGSLASARKLWLTGSDRLGQLGQGRLVERNELAFAFAGASRVVSALNATYYLRPDGSLWFTGIDLRARLGGVAQPTPASDFPVQIATGVTRVAASDNHLLVLKGDGTLWAAGNAYNGEAGLRQYDGERQLRQVASGVREIAAGGYHTLFLKTDGTVWATGANGFGQLGANDVATRYQPVLVAVDASAVAAGASHSVILKTDGSLWTVGGNSDGQLGTGDLNVRLSWVQVATDVVEIAAGQRHTLYRKRDGSVWGMGYNAYRSLGEGTDFAVTAPRRVAALNATAIAAGPASSYLLGADGRLWAIGWGPLSASGTPSVVASDVVQASAGGALAVLRSDGTVWTAGGNFDGALGARTQLNRIVPVVVAEDVQQVSLGENFGVWLDSSGVAWGAGTSVYYQVGIGSSAVATPRRIAEGVVSVSAGARHALFVRSDGSLWGTGSNSSGELGLESSGSFPLTQLASGVGTAFAGEYVSFYTATGDTLRGMGRNVSGQLGTGTVADRVAPTTVFSRVRKVTSWSDGTAVLRTDGTLWVAGNSGGRFGQNVSSGSQSFVPIADGVRDVALGGSQLVWLRGDGTVWARGVAAPFEVWTSGTVVTPQTDFSLLATGAVALAANASTTFVLRSGGELLATGYNVDGQLGNGRSELSTGLMRVGTSVLAVAAGSNHSAFIAPAGFLAVPQPPLITTPPQAQAALLGGSVTFSVVASGDGPLSYQWQRNDVDLPGATSASLTVAPVQASDVGYYSVIVSNAAGTGTSPVAALDVALPPTIVTPPQGGTYYTGMGVSLTVATTGRALSYQWSRDGVPIDGATSATLDLPNLRLDQAGGYRVTVTNVAGTVTSAPAVLTVLAGAAPVITSQPADVTTGLGGRVALTVAATGSPAPAYRWQRQAAGTTTWVDVDATNNFGTTGYDTATLLVSATAVDTTSGHRFRVIVSNPISSVTSTAAAITISGYVAPVTIAGGYKTSIITTADGYAYAMGANYVGQFGDGSLNPSPTPRRLDGLAGVVGAVAGFEHTLYFLLDGSFSTTGFNDFGQLADGTRGTRGTPGRVTHGAVGGAAGYRHTLYHLTDGRLFAAGWNGAGQLGDGTTGSPQYSVKVADDVVRATAGFNHSLFVKGDGTLWAMGANGGLFGNGATAGSLTPVQVATGVADVSASFFHSVYLKRDGSVWTTGQNDRGQLGDGTTTNRLTAASVATGVVEIAAGYKHTVLLKADGTVWTVGANDLGQLGDGTNVDRATPVQVATDVVTIAAGFYTTMILKRDGSVWATGGNDAGQLGDGTTTNRSSFVQVLAGQPSLPAANPAVGATNNPAATRLALAWLPVRGATYYRIWRHTENNRATAVLVGDRIKVTYFQDSSASPGVLYRYWVEAVNPFGAVGATDAVTGVYGAAALPPTITTAPQSASVVVGGSASFTVAVSGVGPFSYQWLKGDAELAGRTSATLDLVSVSAADAGEYRVRVSNSAGSVLSSTATLTVTSVAPTIIDHPVGAAVVRGSAVNLTVTVAGSPPFSYQWSKDGSDLAGATGATLALAAVTEANSGAYRVRVSNSAGSVTSNPATLLVSPPPAAVVQVAAGAAHAGFVRGDGRLFMMGSNAYGQLGDGTTTNRRTPVEVASAVVAVAAGTEHTVFLKQDGTLWGMGADGASQLGGGGAQSTPVQLATDVVAVKAQGNASVFLKRDGTLWGLGENTWGMFGPGPNNLATPRQLGTQVVDFSLGSRQVGYVRADGTLWACGFSRQGELGSAFDLSVFTQVASDVGRVWVSSGATFFLKRDGSLWATGRNFNGQLGDGTTTGRTSPVQVAAGNIVDVSVGLSNLTYWLRANGDLLAVGISSEAGSTAATPAVIATGVAAAAQGGCAFWITTAGTLVGYGYNDDGELGVGGAVTVSLPGQTIASGTHEVPGAPAAMAASAGTVEGAVRLNWTPTLRATSYEVWRGSTNVAADATRIATGVTAPIFFDLGGSSSTPRFYHVRAVSPAGPSAASTVASGFAGERPAITTAPVAQTATLGDAVTFTVAATGSGTLTYQWSRNGQAIDGATGAIYQIPSVTLAAAGAYTVTVSNEVGSVTSTPVNLTVAKLADEITFVRPADRPFTAAPITLSATSRSGLPVTFTLVYGIATLNGNVLTLVSSGEVRLRATTAGNDTYSPAPAVEHTFQVTANVALWLRERFNEADLANPAITGDLADPDGDGVVNLVEYALDLDPRVGSTAPGQVSATATDWTFTYTRPPGRTDVTVAVQFSANLTEWSTGGVSHGRVSVASDSTETWRATVPRTGANGFFRIAVTR